MAALLLTVYVAVALLNYSVVQSYLGAAAGSYFSREWKCTLRIGSLHVMPWDHLTAHNLLLVAPDGDTIFDGETLRLGFRRIPFSGGDLKEGGRNVGTLTFDRVYLANAYYHFASIPPSEEGGRASTNLQFIIDYYNPDHKPGKGLNQTFTVNVGTLVLNHVHYRMDLPDKRSVVFDNGVEIPHMEFYDIRGRFRGVHVVNDDVTVRIVKLSTEERSGFKVNHIKGNVHVSSSGIQVTNLDVETPKSHIMVDAFLDYASWDEMNDYLRTVDHRAVIKRGTTVAMSDVAYWAPVLWGIDVQLKAEGTAHGTIDSLTTDGLHVGYGHATSVDLIGTVTDVAKPENMVVDLEHLGIMLEQVDVEPLAKGVGLDGNRKLMHYARQMEYADLTLSGHVGLKSSNNLSMDLVCGMGNLRADLRAQKGNGGWTMGVDANSDGMGLSLLNSDWLTHSGLSLTAAAVASENKGHWTVREGTADVELTNSVVRGRRMSPIAMHADLSDGDIVMAARSADSLFACQINAHATLPIFKPESNNVAAYEADIKLERLDAYALGLLPEQFGDVKTHINATFSGNTLDSISGGLKATGTHIGDLFVQQMTVDLTSEGTSKRLRIESDPLSMTLNGNFLYADLPLMVRHFGSQVLPEDMGLATAPDSIEDASIAANTINFTAQWNDDGTVMEALAPNIHISRGTRMSGSYNHAELLKMALRGDSIRVGSVLLDNIGLSSRNTGANYLVDMEAQEVNIGKTEMLRRVNVSLGSNRDHTIVALLWGDDEAVTRGDVMLRMDDGNISVVRPDFYIGDTRWTLGIDSLRLTRAGDKWQTVGRGISLASGEQSLTAAIALCHRDNDHLEMDFDHFNLGVLCSVLLQGTNISVDGQADGHFAMYGLGQTPYFNAALTVDSCVVNRQHLGDVRVRSTWNAELNTVNLQLGSKHLRARGWVELGKDDPALSLSANFDGFELALAAPFMSTFSSRFEGQLSGDFDISGTMARPVVLGEALVENGALKVDLTGVTYFFDDSIRFSNNTVTLDNFVLRDPLGNLAIVTGDIRYANMQSLRLNLGLTTDNLLILDQKNGDQFYGTLLASATGTVHGTPDNLQINVSARTRPGCTLTVPVSEQKQVKSQNYITFVGSGNPTVSVHRTPSATRKTKDATPFSLELDLGITPDMQLNLPMDFSEVTVTVGANGAGDLHVSLNEQMSPQVIGNYEIIDGSMKLNMLSLMEKNFTIERGSNLGFQGALLDARFDLKAVYSQRVNLSTLTGNLSTVDNTQKYIQVDDIIAIAGTLQEPSIKFDLRLPNADQSVEEEVFSYIDRNSERDMINQTVSLLLLGQFYNVSGTEQSAANTASTAASGGIGAIASTVGTFMADMVEFVDINVDYKAANEMTNEQLDLNISKDWGRWYLESTLGYGGESRELETSTTNGTVLDALIGYRISPLVHLYAYNRTNTNDYTRMDLPYKQGVGLKLTKDFDRWIELFGIKKKKKKQ